MINEMSCDQVLHVNTYFSDEAFIGVTGRKKPQPIALDEFTIRCKGDYLAHAHGTHSGIYNGMIFTWKMEKDAKSSKD